MNMKRILTVLTLGLTLTSAAVLASPEVKKEQTASVLVGLSSGATVAMADVASNGELWMLTWLLERFGRNSVVSSLSHGDNGATNHILASTMSWGSYYITYTLFNELINPGQPPLNKMQYMAIVSLGLVAALRL